MITKLERKIVNFLLKRITNREIKRIKKQKKNFLIWGYLEWMMAKNKQLIEEYSKIINGEEIENEQN